MCIALHHVSLNFCLQLYMTPDFGFSFTLLQEHVKSFEWFSEDGSDRKHLIVQREEAADSSVIVKLKSPWGMFTKFAAPELLIDSVIEMTVKGDYIFAKKNSTNNSSITSAQVRL